MQSKIGEIYEGTVSGLTGFGAFIKLSNGETGMVHISEVSSSYVKEIRDHLSEGQSVRVKVLGVNENNKISLSIKQADENYQPRPERKTREPREPRQQTPQRPRVNDNRTSSPAQSAGPMSFEDMMAKFKKDSDEKISVLKRSTDFKGGGRRGKP